MERRLSWLEKKLERVISQEVPRHIYGSMYAAEVTANTTATLVGTYYPILSGFTGGSENGCTFQNTYEIKVLYAGLYAVNWSLSLSINAVNQNVEGEVLAGAAGTTAQTNTGNASYTTLNGFIFAVAGSGLITCAVNDLVRLGVKNETSAGKVITMNHATLTLIKI